MAIDAGVTVDGLKDFRRQVNRMDKKWGRELAKMNRELAKSLAPKARSAAQGLGGQHAHFANSITGVGSQTGARLQVAPKSNAAFWGAVKGSGWNKGRVGTGQQPKWVGNKGWEVGGAGGPYALNETIRDARQEIEETYLEAVGQITREAFPGGAPL